MNREQSLEVHEAYYLEDNQLKHCTGECKGQGEEKEYHQVVNLYQVRKMYCIIILALLLLHNKQ